MARTHLAITVELVHGVHTGDLWPRPGRVLIAARTVTFEQLGRAIDDAFARWDHNHPAASPGMSRVPRHGPPCLSPERQNLMRRPPDFRQRR